MANVPEDFDWVAARLGCTLRVAFMNLMNLVHRDVEIAKHVVSRVLEFDGKPDDENPSFLVKLLSPSIKEPIGVSAFTLNKDGEIELITTRTMSTVLEQSEWTFTPRLSDDGERFLDANNGAAYQLWQVSRIALEPLIFR